MCIRDRCRPSQSHIARAAARSSLTPAEDSNVCEVKYLYINRTGLSNASVYTYPQPCRDTRQQNGTLFVDEEIALPRVLFSPIFLHVRWTVGHALANALYLPKIDAHDMGVRDPRLSRAALFEHAPQAILPFRKNVY